MALQVFQKMSRSEFDSFLCSMRHIILNESFKDMYDQLRIATIRFSSNLYCTSVPLLSLLVMQLLFKYAYSTHKSLRKSYFTVGYKTRDWEDGQPLSHIITTKEQGKSQGGAISLDNTYADIWDEIKKRMYIQADKYASSTILSITVHIYLVDCTYHDLVICPEEEITKNLWKTVSTPPSGEVKAPVRRKQSIPNHIPALKATTKK